MAVLAHEGFESCPVDAAVQEVDTIFSDVANVGITARSPGLAGTNRCAEVAPATTGSCRNSGFTPMGNIVVRFLLKFTNAPGADVIIANMCLGDPNLGGTRIANLVLGLDRKLQLKNVYTTVATSTLALSTSTEYALEWRFNGSTKQQTLRIFTDTDSVAEPVETLGPVNANTGPSTVDWVQVGKMTNVTWTGGYLVDGYRRADDWYATASAPTSTWDEEWVGTPDAAITLPTGWAKEGPNTGLPEYEPGGPHVDQSYLKFNGQSTGNRCIRSPETPTGGLYERFYMTMEGKPQNVAEQEEVWAAGNLAGARLFQIVAVSGAGSTYDLQVWADNAWNPYTVDPTPAPTPLGSFTGLGLDDFDRLEIHVDADTGPANIEVRLWRAGNRHSANVAEADVITGACVGTTGLRYRRFCQYLHSTVAANVTHRAVSFDSTAASTSGWVGPIPVASRQPPNPSGQWTFSEWTGTAETPLTLAGASTGGATLEQVNIGDTGVDPPPAGQLFTADPGLGSKLYVSADAYASSDRYNLIADLYNFEMRTLSAGAGHPASNRCAPGCYRGFYGAPRPTVPWGAHTDSTWTIHRKVAANTAMSSWSFDNENYLGAVSQYDGTSDNWLRNQLAPMLKEAYSRYGHLTVVDLANEPDAWNNATGQARVPRWFTATRRAARYIHFFLRDQCAVPEEAFMVACSTTTQATSYGHETRHTKPIDLTGTAWPSGETSRGDAIYYLCPDWKGTRTGWADAYDPKPVDFYQPGEMDEWGYGTGPISRILTTNFYERDYEYANIETLGEFQGKVVSLTGGYPRGGNLFKWNRALYGGADPVLPVPSANSNGVPVFIGELGLGVWVPLPSSANAAQPVATADAYCDVFIKDLVEKCNVVGYAKWRYVADGYTGTDVQIDTYTHHWKVGAGSVAGTHLWDSTNANTKAEAAIFNTAYVADPPPWPNGTVRPPNVWINAGAKRDYRGFNDVP